MMAAARPRLETLGLILGLALTATCSRPGVAPSLVLITIDTLRADHLSAQGYDRATSPYLEKLAGRGVVFDHVVSAIPETAPAFASLLTGLWPARLGIRGNGHPLGHQFPTLASILSGAGYTSAAFVSGFPLIARLSGLDRGFEHYDDKMPDPRGSVDHVQRSARKTTDAALAWLADSRARPFFLWVHYYDPHGDYSPPPPYDSIFPSEPPGPRLAADRIPGYQKKDGILDAAVYVALYDGEIRQVDDQIQRLLGALAREGELQQTIVAVTADHGESLTEHGYLFDHGNELYLPSLRVPLILSGPGLPADGRHLTGLVRTPDIMPTLLDLLGVAPPPALAGISLTPRFTGKVPDVGPEAFSEARFQPYRALTPAADVQPKLAVRDDRFSVILRLRSGKVEVYDHQADPGEQRDLMPSPGSRQGSQLTTDLAAALKRRLTAVQAGISQAPLIIDPGMRIRLEQLAALAPSS